MTKSLLRIVANFAIVLAAALSLSGCDRVKNIGGTGPSPVPIPDPNPDPVPDPPPPEPSPYPDLPRRECAKNLETDEELPDCRMWAELQQGIKPPRGSKVKVGSQFCPDPSSTCLEFDVKYGFKGVNNPNVGMRARVYFSLDGKTPTGEPISNEFQMSGERDKHYGPRIFSVAPKYILIRLEHDASGEGNACNPTCDPAEEGWVSFFVNYEAE